MVETVQQYSRKYLKKEKNTLTNLTDMQNFCNIMQAFQMMQYQQFTKISTDSRVIAYRIRVSNKKHQLVVPAMLPIN